VMTIIIFPISYQYLGEGSGIIAGFQRMIREVPADFLTTLQDTSGNIWFLSAYALSSTLGYNVAWHLAQRYYSVPDERGARKMALLCAGLSFFGPLLWILPVMAAKVIFPDMRALWPLLKEPAEASYVSLALFLLPHGLIGFVVSAVLSATLGQANDAFNWLAATTTRDVFVPLHKRLRGSVPTDRTQLNVARWTMFVVGTLGIAVALYIPRFGGAFQFALQYHSLVAAFMMPVALGMIFRKTPWWSGIASCTAAIAAAITLMAMGVWTENPFARNVFSEAIAATLVFAISARFYRADDPRHKELHRLETDFNTPVPDAPAANASGLAVYGLIGTISIVLGVVLAACMALPSSPLAPATHNLVAGVILILIGVGLRRVASRAKLAPASPPRSSESV
jgi:SSS family solute:Na+ symporter